jgi:hypothetical protein
VTDASTGAVPRPAARAVDSVCSSDSDFVSITATASSLASGTNARRPERSSSIASGCERWGPAWMSLTFVPAFRSITETVPGPRFEIRPVRPSRRIAAPNGWLPVATYRTVLVLVSTIAAASASPSATSSVRPSGETARRSGHDCFCGGTFGGKLSTFGADGGGTGIVPTYVARPVRGSQRRTCTTSPCAPGARAGKSYGWVVEFGSPDTYASRRGPSSATPPLAPGRLSTWITRWRLVEMISTPLYPYPAEIVQ